MRHKQKKGVRGQAKRSLVCGYTLRSSLLLPWDSEGEVRKLLGKGQREGGSTAIVISVNISVEKQKV